MEVGARIFEWKGSLLRAPVGQQHEKANSNDGHADNQTLGLQFAQKHVRHGVGAEAERVRQGGKKTNHITGSNRARAEISQEGLGILPPQGKQRKRAAPGKHAETQEDDDYLHKPDRNAAVEPKDLGFCANDEDNETDD